ncbi:MAG TPA: SRPBCC domain-containing protein [Rhodoglobus sp.]|nr:SRPBCC domain-containing protein [Rhodoglobus sp.]
MPTTPLHFERELALPPVIVWDALVDADLVSGWLGEATVVPEVGGEFTVQWMHRAGRPVTPGRIVLLQPLERLHVDTADAGLWMFELREVPGGPRGAGSLLALDVDSPVEPVFAPRMQADWLTNLDQLAELLAGHPVDWANWGRDMQPTWDEHLGQVRGSTA